MTPFAYRNVIIKRLIIIHECHSIKKKLFAFEYICLTAINTFLPFDANCFSRYYNLKTFAAPIETLISDILHIQLKPFCHQINMNSQ